MDGIAIVTGAAHGIGLAIAQRLGSLGLSVVAVDSDADTLVRAPLPQGTTRLVKDLVDDPVPWVSEVIGELGVPSALVNNVGTMDGRSFLELPMAAVESTVRTTLLGTWALTRAVTMPMVQHNPAGFHRFQLVPALPACAHVPGLFGLQSRFADAGQRTRCRIGPARNPGECRITGGCGHVVGPGTRSRGAPAPQRGYGAATPPR